MTPKQIFKQGSLVGGPASSIGPVWPMHSMQRSKKSISAPLPSARPMRPDTAVWSPGSQAGPISVPLRPASWARQPKIDALRNSKAAALVFGNRRLTAGHRQPLFLRSIEAAQTKLEPDAASRGNGVMGGLAKSLLLTAGAYISVETAARQASAANPEVDRNLPDQRTADQGSGRRLRRLQPSGVVPSQRRCREVQHQPDRRQQPIGAQLYGRLRPLA